MLSIKVTEFELFLEIFRLCFLSGCMYQGQDCRLVIHYERGFSVITDRDESSLAQPLFSYPFENLKMSADDGVRILYLDFGGNEGEIVSKILASDKMTKTINYA